MNAQNRMTSTAKSQRIAVRVFCIIVGLLAALSTSYAQNGAGTQPGIGPVPPTVESIQAEIGRLEQVDGLDAAVRAEATEAYNRALAELKAAEEWRAKSVALEQAVQDAPAKLVAAQQELESASSGPATSVPPDAKLEDIEQLLAKANAELAAAKKNQADLQAEVERRSERRTVIPTLMADAQQRLGKINEELAVIPREGQPEPVAARRVLLEAQRSAAEAELGATEKELASYDAERALLVVRSDAESWRITQIQKLQTELQLLVEAKRQEEAERAAQEAQDLAIAAEAYPPLRDIAEGNAQLTQERTGAEGLAAKISRATNRLVEVSAVLDRLEQEFKGLQQKERVVGKTATYGVWLRRYQAELPDIHAFHRRAKVRRSEMADVQLRLIDLREQRAGLADVNTAIEQVLAGLDPSLSASRRDRTANVARRVLQNQRDNLDAVIKDYDTYFAQLVELDTKVQSIVKTTKDIDSYISERVLWVRSAEVIGWQDVTQSAAALQWLLGPEAWREVAGALWVDLKKHPVGASVWVGFFAALVALRRKMAHQLTTTTHTPKGTFPPVLKAVTITGILALVAPGMIWFLAWRLASAPVASENVRAFAAGLKDSGTVVFTATLLLGICRPNGLGRWYFGWQPGAAKVIRRWLWRALIIVPAMTFLIASVQWREQESWQSSLGRIALMIALLTAALCAHQLLSPSGRVLAQARGPGGRGRLWRFRHVSYALAVGLPVVLTVFAAVGYYHTALHLAGRLTESLWLVVGLLLFNAIGLRWLDIVHRKLATQRQRRHKAEGLSVTMSAGPDGQPSVEQTLGEDFEVGLERANRRSRQLLRSVLTVVFIVWGWSIWSGSLPALRAFDRIELWQHTAEVSVPVTTPDGQTIQETVEELQPTTLADVGLAILVVVLTVIAATDVPAFVEMAVVQRIHYDIGVRYATIAILRYVVVVTGTVLAFGLLGIGWSTVQWLVAAMTVGLGFGLQEIFANFVSGLIILFERPIRIGDTVTIGDTIGTVTKIRIRATTVTDWDRKELIVPNKEFVTGRLVNWTLSDNVLRVIIQVGIAYGSDTELAEKVLYETAGKHPFVLDDPAPVVLFKEFGNSSLGFDLRVYIGDIAHYFPVWHDLHMAIDKAFRAEGITIAFPQRDTHLKTREPLDVRILPADKAKRDGSRERPRRDEEP